MTDLSTLGKRVKQARREMSAALGREVTQHEIAQLMGVTYKTISRWESDKKEPDINTIRRLARVLSANPSFLAFGLEGESGWSDEIGAPLAVRKPLPPVVTKDLEERVQPAKRPPKRRRA